MQPMRLMKIFEWMWAFVAVVAAVMAVIRAGRGESWGSYLYISLFTAGLATFMYFFKKRNREFMEQHEAAQEQQAQQQASQQQAQKQPIAANSEQAAQKPAQGKN